MGDREQLGRRGLGQRNPLTEGGKTGGREVLGGQRETRQPPQLPPELLTNPSGRAIQSFPAGFRRVPAYKEGPRRQLAEQVPPRPLAEPLAPASDPDRELHSSGRTEARQLRGAAGRTPPERRDCRSNFERRSLSSGPLPAAAQLPQALQTFLLALGSGTTQPGGPL